MNLEVFDIIIFITGAALGLIIGLILKKGNLNATKKTTNGTHIPSEAVQFEVERKQTEIDDFFTEANEKFIVAEKAVLELKRQLSTGTNALATSKVASESLNSPETGSTETEEKTPEEPPKDYSIDTSGTLSEDFGLQSKTK